LAYPTSNILSVAVGFIFSRNRVVRYDGSIFPFEDKSFDIGWSNAVIEHVGGEERQIQFLKELCRTCRKVYFTTPNRYFPFEVHTRYPLIHWLPKRIFDKILSLTPKKWATGDYMNLLSKKSLRRILKKAGVEQSRAEQSRAEQSRAEQSRAEQSMLAYIQK
jgi:SAM-dependent methyltransferase